MGCGNFSWGLSVCPYATHLQRRDTRRCPIEVFPYSTLSQSFLKTSKKHVSLNLQNSTTLSPLLVDPKHQRNTNAHSRICTHTHTGILPLMVRSLINTHRTGEHQPGRVIGKLTSQEIKKYVTICLKPGKSTGIDRCPNELTKKMTDEEFQFPNCENVGE